MSFSRKAINFDLSTEALQEHFGENTTPAYQSIKKFMLENGFEHRQYSGYASVESMEDKQVGLLVGKLSKKFTWLSACVKEFDVTDIGEQYSLKDTIQSLCAKEINKRTNHNKDFHTKLKEFKNQTQSNQKLKDIER